MNYKMLFISLFLVASVCQAKGRVSRADLYKLARSGVVKPIKARKLIKPLQPQQNIILPKFLPVQKDETHLFKIINKPLCSKFFDFQYFSLENTRGLNDKPAYPNQDRGIIGACAGRGILGVFDGHGKETGGVVAQYVRDRLPLKLLGARTCQTACSICVALQEEINEKIPKEGALGGTTAIMGLLQQDKNDQFLLSIINIGDSRAIGILSGVVTALSHDHKPTDPKELARIQKAGGVVNGGYVYNKHGHGLALSRSLGDLPAHDNDVVSAEPEVTTYKVSKNDILVFASDGLWDVFSNQEVATFITKRIDKTTGRVQEDTAKELAHIARIKKSRDDITIIIAQL